VNTLHFPVSVPWPMMFPAWTGLWPSVGSLKSYPSFSSAQLLPAMWSLLSFLLFIYILLTRGIFKYLMNFPEPLPTSAVTWFSFNSYCSLLPQAPLVLCCCWSEWEKRWFHEFWVLSLPVPHDEEMEAKGSWSELPNVIRQVVASWYQIFFFPERPHSPTGRLR
jgi:hypothetical protein